MLLATLVVFGVASVLPYQSIWGLNHLRFLGNGVLYVYFAVLAIAVLVFVGWLPTHRIDAFASALDRHLFGSKNWPRISLALACMVLFYLFRARTCLLGDGCAWLDNFGQGQTYIHKWTEPGSIYLIRWLQSLQGDFSRQTATTAFHIISIVSGGIFVYNVTAVVKQLCQDKYARLLALITTLLSGAILLFFGYIEFYALSWAIAALFINLSLRFISNSRVWWGLLLSWGLGVMMHLQALYFLPGLIYLFLRKIKKPELRKAGYYGVGGAALIAIGLICWLYQTRIEVALLMLPSIESRPAAPGYTMFSPLHLRDLANLILLVFPGAAAVMTLWFFGRNKSWRTTIPAYLTVLSAGSVAFLCLFGAAITMGRDWDIMSLSLLPPALLALYHIDRGKIPIPSRTLAIYVITVAFMTISYVAVSVKTVSAEQRAYSLLNDYNRNAWLNYGRYYYVKGDTATYQAIVNETMERFPDYATFRSLNDYLARGEHRRAMALAQEITDRDPYNPEYLWVLAAMHATYGNHNKACECYALAAKLKPYDVSLNFQAGQYFIRMRKFDKAVPLLKKSHRLSPDDAGITENLAIALANMNRLNEARLLADSLFMRDRDSPGAHLIMLMIAVDPLNLPVARHHYREYLEHGTERPEYEAVKDNYKQLATP